VLKRRNTPQSKRWRRLLKLTDTSGSKFSRKARKAGIDSFESGNRLTFIAESVAKCVA
jgi:hypothetical protein